jgi:2-polyprenyl-3-methyl-5-hydroxy-6-metoxy-1,4-benzoquinol methylase
MTDGRDLLSKESHFEFGKNWASYSELIDEVRVEKAVQELRRLAGDLTGKSFLDIGCGSGLHSLAALRLGAARVVSIDLDSDSVATTQKVLARHAPPGSNSKAFECSVFDLDKADLGTFDVVYSWGVLHHTGDMYRAIRCAAQKVAPGGTFVFALYRKTWLCGFWKVEKRWYTRASAATQARARAVYVFFFRLAHTLTGRDFDKYVAEYDKWRGMEFHHDVHDWMGGFPYESISPDEAEAFMTKLGFRRDRVFVLSKTPVGIFGSGCDEFVYSRT